MLAMVYFVASAVVLLLLMTLVGAGSCTTNSTTLRHLHRVVVHRQPPRKRQSILDVDLVLDPRIHHVADIVVVFVIVIVDLSLLLK
jgi:hypothetical protein